MLKRNRRLFFLTAVIAVSPMIIGLLLWNQLPDTIATHFDFQGTPNGWSSKGFAVFGLPLFLLGIHVLCAVVTAADPRRQNIHDKLYRLVLWICPLISLLACCSVYLYALGTHVDVTTISGCLIGVLFIIIGNYLPKCRQNYTIGIKLPWTLASEDNWNHTHRLAGWLWIAGGVILLLGILFGFLRSWILLPIVLVMVLIPTVYSYFYYRKYEKDP